MNTEKKAMKALSREEMKKVMGGVYARAKGTTCHLITFPFTVHYEEPCAQAAQLCSHQHWDCDYCQGDH